MKKVKTKGVRIVQTRNPKTGHYIKIDKALGKIVAHKKTPGPYKNVAIVKKSRGK